MLLTAVIQHGRLVSKVAHSFVILAIALGAQNLRAQTQEINPEPGAEILVESGQGLPVEGGYSEKAPSLKEILPSTLGKKLVQAAEFNIKAMGKSAVHSTVQVVPQQAIFVAVMAGLNAFTINQAIAEDPLAWQRTVTDPWSMVGIAGFQALMFAQSYSGHSLSYMFPSKGGNPYLFPSITMGIGMGFSMYVSNILNDPNVAVCSRLMFGNFEMNRTLKALSPDKAKDELARRRERLFTKYDLPQGAEPCDRAFEHLIIQKKLWELAPELASVVSTTLFLAAAPRWVAQGGKVAAAKIGAERMAKAQVLGWVLKMTPLMILPGGPAGATARFVVTAASKLKFVKNFAKTAVHLAAFIKIDHMLKPYLSSAWKSAEMGLELNKLSHELERGLLEWKNQDWRISNRQETLKESDVDQECMIEYHKEVKHLIEADRKDAITKGNVPGSDWKKLLPSNMSMEQKCFLPSVKLRQLHNKSVMWRQKILSPVETAHRGWEDFVKKYMALMEGSHDFYKFFIELRNASTDRRESTILDETFPTFGILRGQSSDRPVEDFYRDPKAFKREQVVHLKSVLAEFRKVHRVDPKKDEVINEVLSKLDAFVASAASDKIELNKVDVSGLQFFLDQKTKFDMNFTSPNDELGKKIREQLHWLYTELGEPRPLMEPGRGSLYLFRDIESARPTFNQLDAAIEALLPVPYLGPRYNSFGENKKWTSSNQRFAVDDVADKLLIQMACGPKPGEPVVQWKDGWRTEFYPPSIINNVDEVRETVCKGWGRDDIRKLYTDEFTIRGKKYKGIVAVISANLRPELDDAVKFEKWWRDNIKPSMDPIMLRYRWYYNTTVSRLVQNLEAKTGLLSPETFQSAFNLSGTLSDEVLEGIEQEVKYNLAILGDIYETAIETNLKKMDGTAQAEFLKNIFSIRKMQPTQAWCQQENCTILSQFKKSRHMSLSKSSVPHALLPNERNPEPQTLNGNKLNAPYRNFRFQETILEEVKFLRWMLTQVKEEKKDGVTLFRSRLKQSEITENLTRFELVLDNEVSARFNMNSSSVGLIGLAAEAMRYEATPQEMAERVRIPNPVTHALAVTARDNIFAALAELRTYAQILTISTLFQGEQGEELMPK